jgi:hypothetical protein
MKNSDFKKISSVLTKTARAFELTFDKAEVEKASIVFESDAYEVKFECYVEDIGVGQFSVSCDDFDAKDLIAEFLNDLNSQVETKLLEARKIENERKELWNNSRVYSHEISHISTVTSLELIQEIIQAFLNSVT